MHLYICKRVPVSEGEMIGYNDLSGLIVKCVCKMWSGSLQTESWNYIDKETPVMF